MINVKDANGKWCVITPEDFMEALQENTVNILGMSLKSILTFRKIYMKRGGFLDPTPERIEDILG
jgi:hypothetical protein